MLVSNLFLAARQRPDYARAESELTAAA